MPTRSRKANAAESRAIIAGLQRYEEQYQELLRQLRQSCIDIEQEFAASGLGETMNRAWTNHVLRYMSGHPDDLGPKLDVPAPTESLYKPREPRKQATGASRPPDGLARNPFSHELEDPEGAIERMRERMLNPDMTVRVIKPFSWDEDPPKGS